MHLRIVSSPLFLARYSFSYQWRHSLPQEKLLSDVGYKKHKSTVNVYWSKLWAVRPFIYLKKLYCQQWELGEAARAYSRTNFCIMLQKMLNCTLFGPCHAWLCASLDPFKALPKLKICRIRAFCVCHNSIFGYDLSTTPSITFALWNVFVLSFSSTVMVWKHSRQDLTCLITASSALKSNKSDKSVRPMRGKTHMTSKSQIQTS